MHRFLLPLIALSVLLTSTADAAAPRTCRSGHGIYAKQGVRVFSVYSRDDDTDDYYACGPRTRRPVHIHLTSATYGGLRVLGRTGDKVLWHASASGEGGGDYSTVGWFDARTAEARSGELVGEVSNEVLDMVVATDGGVGITVAADGDDQGVRVGYLARGPKRGRLRGEQALAIAGEGYVKRSLAFAGATLAWTAAGQLRSVPLSGESLTCTAGATVAESEGARLFEVFQRHRDVLAGCSAGEPTPRTLARTDVSAQSFWTQLPRKQAAARVALLGNGNAVVVLDGGQVTLTRPDGIESVQDVALAATGPVVLAGTARGSGQRLIALLTGQRLALQGATIKPGTLAVGERVTWETTDGLAQSVPLAGETTVDCTTGTTLHARDGLRVFEQLSAADARLLACAPGATAPVQLLAAAPTASWRIFEAAREDGRFAVYAGSESRGTEDRFISFDAEDAVTAVPKTALVGIKDVALAPDGRSAFALRESGKWRIVAYAGGVERAIAKPGDGVQAGSLAIDGARLVWRNLAGAERSAAL